MNSSKSDKLIAMLKQVSPSGDISRFAQISHDEIASFESVGSEQLAEQYLEAIDTGIKSIERNKPLSEIEQYTLEAIVLPKGRPVVDVINDTYGKPGSPWEHLGRGAIKTNITNAIPSIGRIELPEHPQIPFGGTGFVVGKDLLMTNRHVAQIFADGLGLRQLTFKTGAKSAVNFVEEVKPRESTPLEVREIVMIHPHWDMALLRVDGLLPDHPVLKLSTDFPDDLVENEIAVIGYPAQDARNDFQLQMDIFRRKFNVKRMQPGKLRARQWIVDGFRNRVQPLAHDASTLGGNSGSAVIDVKSGNVVGLHFSGRYLVANFCVPMYELARDPRVVDCGVNFRGTVPPTSEWDDKWDEAERVKPSSKTTTPKTSTTTSSTVTKTGNQTTITVPLQITVSFGDSSIAVQQSVASDGAAEQEGLKIPVIHPGLNRRKGYDPAFLDLDDAEIALPKMTSAGKHVVAKLESGSPLLNYHHFSVVMHKERRLALFTASNVDWRKNSRIVNGTKPSRKELTGLGKNDIEQWVTDPRIPEDHQLPDIFFTKDRASFDKGHLVRRDDVCWGKSFEDIQKGNGDTYHTTNCSPQVKGFNQATQGEDNWGDLEVLIEKQTKAEKAIVFAGPVFTDEDPVFKGVNKHGNVEILIPQSYWKIIVTKGDDGPQAFGFVLEQELHGVSWEMAVPEPWKQFMRPISEIEDLLGGLAKLNDLIDYDQYESAEGIRIRKSLK